MNSALETAHRSRTAICNTEAKRARNLKSSVAVSVAALFLSGCGGGDGSAPGEGVQSDASDSQYRSFVSTNPQARAAIEAEFETKDAGSSDSRSDDPAGDSSSGNSSDDSSDDSSSDSGATGASGDLVETLISDMREMNDHPLKNVNPVYGFSKGPGYVLAGNNPRGNGLLLPWFVQFEGEGNAARNTRVQMRNLRLFIKSRSSGTWKTVFDTDAYSGIQCDQGGNYFECPQRAQVSEDSEGASSLPLSELNLHGWWGGRHAISGDIAAIVVTLQARLITDPERGGDDRSKAKYLIQVGADYYRTNAPPDAVLPSVGISRAKMVTNDWQTFALSTLNDVGKQEPGGGISADELRANPPPLD